MEPSKPPSSSPTACSRVDLPEPDGPSRATISPSRTFRSTPRSTWISTSAWTKLRLRPSTRSTSFIAQHLHRIRLRRLPGRIEGEKEGRADRQQDDQHDLKRIGPRWQLRDEPDAR